MFGFNFLGVSEVTQEDTGHIDGYQTITKHNKTLIVCKGISVHCDWYTWITTVDLKQ